MIVRLLGAALLALALGAPVHAWPLSYGGAGANRVVAGKGTFPRLLVISAVVEAPIRWIVSLPPRRLAGIDANGTLWIFEVGLKELGIEMESEAEINAGFFCRLRLGRPLVPVLGPRRPAGHRRDWRRTQRGGRRGARRAPPRLERGRAS